MKKILSLCIIIAVLFTGTLSVYAMGFTDFNQSHWAYEYVNSLVNSGTINGFTDGSFRPEATVTRAEFVKMIGYGPERRNQSFDDVPENHWAYEYIMTSGLDAAYGNVFNPDVAITRGEVSELLWKRAGSEKGITAPPVIHRQGRNHDAVSWVYTNGIMRGDDNINLRLNDSLTRAEAAALIVRSTTGNSSVKGCGFMDGVDSRIFALAYDAFRLGDESYNDASFITNGELAMMAARMICDERNPTYRNISATVSFDHKYSQALNMLCRYYLGNENDNAEYINKNATVKEAIAALMFATSRSSHSVILPGNRELNYAGASDETNEKMKDLLSTAYNNGICFNDINNVPLEKEITRKELACLLLGFDGFSGIYTADRLGISSYYKDFKLNTNPNSYPENSDNYRIILDAVPDYVYEAPFVNAVKTPEEFYDFSNTVKSVFETLLVTWISRAYNSGAQIAVTYYPGLCTETVDGYTLRVLVEIENVDGDIMISDIIKTEDESCASKLLVEGDSFYADIHTGVKITSIPMISDRISLGGIIG